MRIGLGYVVIVTVSGPVIEWWGNATVMYTALGIVMALTILPLGIQVSLKTPSET